MTDRRFLAAAVRSTLRRPLAAAAAGLLAVHCLPAAAQAQGDPAQAGKKDVNALQEITIQAQRTSEAVARLAQMQAPNIIDIETYQTIKQLPDVTTAEAVERIPGISRETDEGEARYINIRGLDADYNSTTFDGVRLMPTNNASPLGNYRAVTLDIIPIGIVGAITVTKSNLPSQDAEALGGTINITPKTAPLGGKPFLEGRVGGGYEPLRSTPVIDLQISGGTRFGGSGAPAGGLSAYSDSPFSVVGTLAYYEDKRGIDDVEPAYINNGPTGAVYTGPLYSAINDLQQRDYELNRKRYAWSLSLSYQPDADHEYYVRGFQTGYSERYWRNFLELIPDGNPAVNGAGQIVDTLNNPGAINMSLRDERETDREQLYMIGGRDTFGGGTILDYRAAFTEGTWHKPYDYGSTFSYTDPTGNPNIGLTYSPTGQDHTPLYTIAGADYLNPANYQLSGFGNQSAYNYDKMWTFAADLDLPVTLIGGGSSEDLKLGVSAELRKKGTSTYTTSYATLPALTLTQASGGSPPESYYDGQYMNPPDIRPGYLQSILGPGTQAYGDFLGDLPQFLMAHEDIYAAFAQYHLQWDRFGVIGGFRVENSHEDLRAFQQVGIDANQNATYAPVRAVHSYTNVFPSLQGRFAIRPRLIARATWSSTIARPGFNQLTPSRSIDLGAYQANVGNPDLKPAYANSFDADISQYLPHAGVVSAGIFDKQIKDMTEPDFLGYIATTAVHGFPSPIPEYGYSNVPHSYARGLELNYEQRLSFLPGLLGGLGVGGNYTYVDSRTTVRRTDPVSGNAYYGHVSMVSTSKNTWNATVFYERSGLTLRVAAYSVSADLFALGSDPSTDIYNAKRTYLDFGSSYGFSKHWELYFNVQNLLNTPHMFWQGSADRPIQREFYGQTYQAGFRFDY